jgi:hypothetical protein
VRQSNPLRFSSHALHAASPVWGQHYPGGADYPHDVEPAHNDQPQDTIERTSNTMSLLPSRLNHGEGPFRGQAQRAPWGLS